MNQKKTWPGMMVLALVFGVLVIGCPTEPDEPTPPPPPPTYTVWTDLTSYSEFQSVFGTLNDGYYTRYEFTSSGWNSISPSLTNEGKHNWTESEIKNWFIGRGFGNAEATQETAWLMTIDHGFIASRTQAVVYMLLK